MKKYFDYLHRGIRVSVKIRLTAVAKSTFEISLRITPNLIPTRKIEIFWGQQKAIIRSPPCENRDGVPEAHKAYYLSDLIRTITLIQMYPPKSPLRHRGNRISISSCFREIFKIYEIKKSGAYMAP